MLVSTGLPDQEFVLVVQECILQLCGIMWQLHHSLGMNHRDVKPSNLLLVNGKVRVGEHVGLQVPEVVTNPTNHTEVLG
jgi:serine/threonine protein kinase